jgi:hypothetical protein
MEAISKIAAYFNLNLSDYDKRKLEQIIAEEKTIERIVNKRVLVYKEFLRAVKPVVTIEQYYAEWVAEHGEIPPLGRKREAVRQRVNFSRQAYKDGYSYGEIAKVLGLSNHTSILHYVKRCKL